MEDRPGSRGENDQHFSAFQITSLDKKHKGSNSTDNNCSICLDVPHDKSFTNSCLHTFCFKCLVTWGKIKSECPLCKRPFVTIIHMVKSEKEYCMHEIYQKVNGEESDADTHFDSEAESSSTDEERRRWPGLLNLFPEFTRLIDPSRTAQGMQLASRRRVYTENVYAVATYTETMINITPQYFLDHSEEIIRIFPWLYRELEALLLHTESMVVPLFELITRAVTRHSILSMDFKEKIFPFLGENTEHFQHEFACFCASRLAMRAYDSVVTYNWDTDLENMHQNSRLNSSSLGLNAASAPNFNATVSNVSSTSVSNVSTAPPNVLNYTQIHDVAHLHDVDARVPGGFARQFPDFETRTPGLFAAMHLPNATSTHGFNRHIPDFNPTIPNSSTHIPEFNNRYVPDFNTRYIPDLNNRYSPDFNNRYTPDFNTRYIPDFNTRYNPPTTTFKRQQIYNDDDDCQVVAIVQVIDIFSDDEENTPDNNSGSATKKKKKAKRVVSKNSPSSQLEKPKKKVKRKSRKCIGYRRKSHKWSK